MESAIQSSHLVRAGGEQTCCHCMPQAWDSSVRERLAKRSTDGSDLPLRHGSDRIHYRTGLPKKAVVRQLRLHCCGTAANRIPVIHLADATTRH